MIKINSQNQYNQINQSDYTVIAVPNLIDKKHAIEKVKKLTKKKIKNLIMWQNINLKIKLLK